MDASITCWCQGERLLVYDNVGYVRIVSCELVKRLRQAFRTQYTCLDLILPCIIIARWLLPSNLSYLYANSVFQRYKCSILNNKVTCLSSCSCFCCYFDFFTACRFLSCTVPKRRLWRLLFYLPVLFIALGFLTLLNFVCRRLNKDFFIGRIGCTQQLRQFPRHRDSGVSFFPMVYFVPICTCCSSSSCRLLELHWELWVRSGSTVHWLLIPLIKV